MFIILQSVCVSVYVCVCVSLPTSTRGAVAHGTQGSFDFLLVSIAHSFCADETCTLAVTVTTEWPVVSPLL